MTEYNEILKKYFGFDTFRDNQLDIIKSVIEDKRDVFAILFTGAGKSLLGQFPPVYTNKIAINVCPLISLMHDQKQKMDAINIPAICLNGTVYNKNKLKDEILENKYRIVYTTPEYLITQESFFRELDMLDMLVAFVIDEAHCISAYGNEFRESYKKLNCLREWCPNVPIVCLTATATQKVQLDIIKSLKLKNQLLVKSTFDRPNLLINVIPKGNDIIKDLMSVIKKNEPTIIYCQTRNMTDNIASLLTNRGINSLSYHAGMSSKERNEAHDNFATSKINCIVCTIAYGLGINLIVRKVIHYGIPQNIESYYQEIGRAGRDGKKSECILFYSLNDMNQIKYQINKIANVQYRTHMIQLAMIVKSYLFSNDCRRKFILEYFSEKYPHDNCKMCDNCLKVKQCVKKDFSVEAKIIFDLMNFFNNSFGSSFLIKVLRGANLKTIKQHVRKSPLYGAGKHHSEQWWKIFIVMLINNGYIKEKSMAGCSGFLLSNTPKSIEWLVSRKIKHADLLLDVPTDMQNLGSKKKKQIFTIDDDLDDITPDALDDIIDSVYNGDNYIGTENNNIGDNSTHKTDNSSCIVNDIKTVKTAKKIKKVKRIKKVKVVKVIKKSKSASKQ